MPMHPAAPQDLHGLVEAFAQTAQAVADLGHGCREADFELPTQCPGWTVKDQISHIVGVEGFLEGYREARVELPAYAHVRTKLGKRVEYAVHNRRARSGGDVVVELEHVLAARFATLRSPGLAEDSIIAGPFGADEAASVLRTRAIDVWVHEQDIRQALRRPGNLDSPAATLFVRALFDALPRLVARDAGIEPGHIVIFDVTGPVLARSGVRVELGEDGRPFGTKMFTGEPMPEDGGHTDWETTSISLSTDALTRRAGGRVATAETVHQVTGDQDIARRVLDALVIMP